MNKIKKCVGKESFERMNYLYQIANELEIQNESNNRAANMYSNLLVNISKKTVQRMDVEIKRSICKGCRILLHSGITAKVRIKKKKVIWRCLNCNTVKTFDIRRPDYTTWTEKTDSIKEILDYTPSADS